MEDKLCIIIHPIDRDLLYNYEPGMKKLSIDVTKKILEWMSPFKASYIEGIKSYATGKVLNAELIMCPLLMEQMVSSNPRKILNRVIKAAKFGKDQGAKLLGLVAYTAMVGARGLKVYQRVNIPLTVGTHMSLAVVPDTVLKAVNLLGYQIKKLKVLILGANQLGNIVLRKLGYALGQIYLYSSKRDKVITFYNYLPSPLKKKVKVVFRDPRYILKDIDIIINASDHSPTVFDEKYLKKGAIIFDASYPRSINITRDDVLLTDGLVMEPPGRPNFNFNFGLPEGLCFPCMVEPIVLYFEKRYEPYSLGKDISLAKAEEIYKLSLN